MDNYLKLIDEFLEGKTDYGSFYRLFSELYSSDATSRLPEEQFEFIDQINDRLSFTGEKPTEMEKEEHNYIDSEQFKKWLQEHKNKHPAF